MPPAGRVALDTPVGYLKGVGPIRAEAFRKLGITRAGDLLFHIPHRYEDASSITPISKVDVGMDATVVGKVVSKGVLPTRKGLRIFQAVVQDRSGMLEAAWPGQPFLDRSIDKGDVLLLSGPIRFYHGRQLAPREFVNLGPDDPGASPGRVFSVYPATEGLTFRTIRSIVDAHLDTLLARTTDHLPRPLLKQLKLPPLADALRMVHRPTSIHEAEQGRDRLAFDELMFVQLLHRRAHALARTARRGIRFVNKRELTTKLKSDLPFDLTGAQVRVLREIFADMCGERRMHRLLQGDVGSGKTIVALFAALLAYENGYQAAIMAPTELLAEQHYRTLTRLLAPLQIEPLLLTGSVKTKSRVTLEARLKTDEPVIAIGTHALVQSTTAFGRLGFVAIDEQHRFGVEQRAALAKKGQTPDVLLLSATPIPRSLALTVYGDLDVSTLDERPPGRQPVTTVLRRGKGRDKVLSFVRSQVEEGRQAYVVYPVIEESEKTDLKAATTMYEQLSAGAFTGLRVALLHGRIPSDQRETTMRQFRDGEIDILVATTVIEVGIDVANATVMLIEHPERFGLSQLHQLRGRVGRGAESSYCILLGDAGQESMQRLELFASTDDGFEIARADLRIRGMGDLFGQQQSGEALLRIADLVRDEKLNVLARKAAEDTLAYDPALEKPQNAGLKRALSARFPRALELFRVG